MRILCCCSCCWGKKINPKWQLWKEQFNQSRVPLTDCAADRLCSWRSQHHFYWDAYILASSYPSLSGIQDHPIARVVRFFITLADSSSLFSSYLDVWSSLAPPFSADPVYSYYHYYQAQTVLHSRTAFRLSS
jgi:hypothetical protein